MHKERVFVLSSSIFLWCIISCLATAGKRFLFELKPNTETQWSLLRTLYGKSRSYVFLNDVQSNSRIYVLVVPKKMYHFLTRLTKIGVEYEAKEIKLQNMRKIQLGDEYNWTRYHTLNETYDWLHSLPKLYPAHASLFVAGKSYEGRDLLGIKISHGDDDRKAIFLEGGIHAREWISPAITTFIAHQLLTNPQEDVLKIAESFDWYILPHVNPDGYVYSHTTDRLWRKTRSLQANGCVGVDLNRNFDFHWNETDSGSDPCDETFAGPQAFSEIESRTISDYITKLKDKLFLYISFHSYSQKLLYPYGYTSKLPANNVDLKRIYNAAVTGLRLVFGTNYTGGNVYDNMYPASGGSMDWVYAVAGVNYTFTYELCPLKSSVYRFELPDEWIIPTGKETFASLVQLVREAAFGHTKVMASRTSLEQNY